MKCVNGESILKIVKYFKWRQSTEKMFKNQIFSNLLSTVLFGLIYSLLSYADKGYVEFRMILMTMAFYFVFMCLLCLIAPKLRRITGHDKDNSL